ncbi:MAG: hypothetical protein ABSA91_00690 [Acidimicrobiales bacterium]|jgi:hypothetical protein
MDAKVLLCDFAEVSGGKLFVSGAGLALVSSATPTPPFRVNITLAVLGLINIGDTDLQHKMTIELVNVGANGETRVMLSEDLPDVDTADKGMIIAYFVAPRSPQMLPADEWSMPMAIPLFGLGLPVLGPYYFSVRIDGREMDRTSFRVMPFQAQQGGLPPEMAGAAPAPSAGDAAPDGSQSGLALGEPPL